MNLVEFVLPPARQNPYYQGILWISHLRLIGKRQSIELMKMSHRALLLLCFLLTACSSLNQSSRGELDVLVAIVGFYDVRVRLEVDGQTLFDHVAVVQNNVTQVNDFVTVSLDENSEFVLHYDGQVYTYDQKFDDEVKVGYVTPKSKSSGPFTVQRFVDDLMLE